MKKKNTTNNYTERKNVQNQVKSKEIFTSWKLSPGKIY